jgi:hypothetical protein
MLWRSEIHINLKIGADVLTDDDVAFVSSVQYVISIKGSEGSMLVSAHAQLSLFYFLQQMVVKCHKVSEAIL